MNKRISLVLVLALVFSLIQPVWSMRLALASGDMVKPADKDVYFDNDGSHVSGEDIGALIGGGPLYVNFVGPDSEYGNQRTMINFADLDSDLPTTISSVTMRLFIPYVFVHTNAPYDAVVTVNASNITNWEADSVSDFPADNNDPLLDHLQNIRVATKKNNGMNNEDTVDPGNVDTTSTGCTPIPGVLLGCLNLDVTDYVKNKISGGAADITFLLSGATLQTTSAYFTIYPNENETYRPQLIFAGETAPVPAQTAEAGAQTLTPVAGADNTVTLTVKDSQGNVDTGFTGSHSVTISGAVQAPNGTYGTFGGTTLDASASGAGQAIGVTFTDGVATAALALHQAEAQTIGFSIAGVATPATNSLTITPKAGALAALTLSQDVTAPPVNGGVFAQQPVVRLVDAYGNLVSTDSSTQVTASKKDAGSWTLIGTATVTANAGVATFSGLGAMNAAEVNGAQLAFHAGALPEITSTPVTLPAPAAAQTAEAGAQTLTPEAGADNTVTLTVKDSLGNVDTSFTGTHSVTINGAEPAPNGTYGTFAGTALDASAAGGGQAISATFANGVATAALALNKAEAQTIGFSIAGVATPATNSLTIAPKAGALAALTLLQDMTAPSVNGGTFAQQPVVKFVDAYGNLVSTDSSTQVTASKKDAGSWTLIGTATVTANAGVATFSGLGAANAAEVSGAQLAFHAGALPEITSTAVMLPAPASAQTAEAGAQTLTPIAGADYTVTLTVKDSLGNVDTSFTGTHSVTINGAEPSPNGTYGTFAGTALDASAAGAGQSIDVTFTNGAATAALALNKAESQTISFSVAGVATPATNSLTIMPKAGALAALTLSQDVTAPPVNGGAFAQQPVVKLVDAYGNLVSTDSSTQVTVSRKDAGSWTLTGKATVTANAGVATFSGLGAVNAVEVSGAQLAFHAGGLQEITSSKLMLLWPDPTAPVLTLLEVKDQSVTIGWEPVYGSVTYSVYQRTGNEIYIDPTMTVAGSVYNATITGLINGITYSFVIKASHPGGASGFSNEVSATPSTVPASPTNVTAVAGNGQATISFTIPADDGGSPITAYEVTASPGNVVITGTSSPITVTGLTNGTSYTFTVKAVNGAGSSASSAESNVVRPVAPSRNNHNSSPSSPSTPSSQTDTPSQTETTDVGVNVFVNGKVENAGTATISQKDNQTVTTIAVDQKKLDDKLAAEGQGALVTIPLNTKSDVVVGELTGQMVKNMEDKQAVLQIKTDQASYTLPANQINIGSVSAQIGTSVALSDIKVQIEIAAPAADTVKVVENAAKQGTFMLVVPPVEFTVRAVHGDKTIEVTKFNAYVERTIAIPDGVDLSKITTGVVVDPDGTVRHVPTKVVQMEGKYYAVINSLTNSTYSVVWHPITFSDVANHWSKDAVNDMGSRMVINGTGEDTFSPDRDITRAEFAAIIVRGLGLRLEKGVAPFSDVKESDWYSGAIKTAYEYHLINGFEDGTFHPMDNITREQAMVILSEAMRLTELKAKLEPKAAEETLRAFTDDSSASPWAADGIADSVEAGIVSGREGMQLAPKAFITRAEVAAMIKRLLQNSGLI